MSEFFKVITRYVAGPRGPKGDQGDQGPPGSGGVTDHGALSGLGDDDHSQYHNDARGDARYYQKGQVDTALAGKANTSHTHTASQITDLNTYVQAKIDELIAGAPGALDTLNELAAALGDDPNFATTITTALAGKAATNHTHAIAQVTGLQTALDGKQASGNYAAAVHTHSASQITDFNASVDGRIARRKANAVWCPIFFRGRGVRGSGSTNTVTATGTAGVTSQTIGWSPKNIPVLATRLIFANFDMTANGEADTNSTNTWTNFAASLNYQNVNTVPPSYTFHGARTTSFAPAAAPMPHSILMTDPLFYPLPANSAFGIRVSGQLPGSATLSSASYTGVDPSNNSARITNGAGTPGGAAITNFSEFDNRLATGWTDQSQNATNLTATGGSGYTHAPFVLGLMHPPAASVGIIGDSLAQGQGDQIDDLFNVGYVARSLRNDIPHINLARGSMRADQFDTMPEEYGILSILLASGMYLTDIYMALGRNDINANTVAAVKASVANACLPFQQQGIPCHVATIPPWTASQDAWATEANQFYIYAQPTTTADIPAGATSFTVSSAANITNGMLVASANGQGIAPGTTVTVSGTTVTLSQATTALIASGTTMSFGNQTLNPYATKALQYNADLKAGYADLAYNNNGFAFASVRDYPAYISSQTGGHYKWKGGTPLTLDGTHMAKAGHDLIVASGVVAPATWGIW